MTHRRSPAPSETVDHRRALVAALAAATLALAIAAIPVERPSTWTVPALDAWVAQRGPVAFAIVLAQAVAVIVAAALALAGASATMTDRSEWAGRVNRRLAPESVRRWWAGGAMAVAITTASVPAGAVEAIDEETPPTPMLIDLGPAAAAGDTALLHDLGPIALPIATPGPSAPTGVDLALVSSAVSAAPLVADHLGGETWPVAAGDHLWHIAESTLLDRGEPTDETSILAYWQQLIDTNRIVLGDDVDLIHPGEVIHLPASVTAGS